MQLFAKRCAVAGLPAGAAADARLGVKIKSLILDDPIPSHAILAMADDFDIICMGSRSGRNAGRRTFIGSTTINVTRECDVPVLVVPPRPLGAGKVEVRIRHVLVCLDNGDAALHMLSHAIAHFSRSGATITAVNVGSLLNRHLIASLKQDILTAHQVNLNVLEVAPNGSISETIMSISSSYDFIVAGSTCSGDSRSSGRRLLGSTSEGLVKGATVPTLIGRCLRKHVDTRRDM